jgi:large subunit ribosomal protein L15
MIGLNNLKAAHGARHRRKIIGRGEGSGHGGSATMGMKGQTSRSGDGKMIGFEGGQMPLVRRVPKRGFNNKSRVAFVPVNLVALEKAFDNGSSVDLGALIKAKLVNKGDRVKVLANGEIKKKLNVKVHAYSKLAAECITKAGGTAEVIKGPAPLVKFAKKK